MALDSNGVWQYEETDSEATASDLLNLGMASVSGRVAGIDASLQAVDDRSVTLTGTQVVSSVASGSGALDSAVAVLTTTATGATFVTWRVFGEFNYVSGGGPVSMFRVATDLRPDETAAVSICHGVNGAFGRVKADGVVEMTWGSFGSSGTTDLYVTATYPISAS